MRLIVNGQAISESVLNAELMRLSAGLEMDAPHAGGLDPTQQQRLAMQNVVHRTLLLQRAIADRLCVTKAEADHERLRRWGSNSNSVCGSGVRSTIVEDMLVDRVSAHITRHVPRTSRSQCEQFYHSNVSRYDFPEAVRAAHIVCHVEVLEDEMRAEETLKLATAHLAAGTLFARVADLYSDCKGVGGSLGWVARGEMVPAFEEVVFALPLATNSGVFRTIFGLHIARVEERRKAGRTPFDKVRPEIAKHLLDQRRQAFLSQTLREMEQASEIYTVDGDHG